MKYNRFLRNVECWSCSKKIHKAVITRCNGILCKGCYITLYKENNTIRSIDNKN